MAHVMKAKASALGGLCEHYERKAELERGYERENIDPERMELNYNLAPTHEQGQVAFINQRIEELQLKRLRKDAVRMCSWVITQPKDLPAEESKAFFESAYAHLEGLYGRENVVSAYVHLDESQPHMHFAFVPVTPDGRLSAKDILTRAHLKGFHEGLQKAVEGQLGHPVGVLLSEEQKGARELDYMGIESFQAATAAAAAAEERLEYLRQAESAIAAENAQLRKGAARAREDDILMAAKAGLARGRDGERERALASELEELRARKSALEGENAQLRAAIKEGRGRAQGLRIRAGAARAAIAAAQAAIARLGALLEQKIAAFSRYFSLGLPELSAKRVITQRIYAAQAPAPAAPAKAPIRKAAPKRKPAPQMQAQPPRPEQSAPKSFEETLAAAKAAHAQLQERPAQSAGRRRR